MFGTMRTTVYVGIGLVAAVALAVGATASAEQKAKDAIRKSKFFEVDVQQKKILGAATYIQPALRLDLTSVSTDQPQYWPHEKVYLKVLALSRPGQTLTGTWQKRDAASHPLEVKLNADGVAVVEILDGGKRKTELGEYRIDLHSADKKTEANATFAVVDGALGAISFAHEWKRVTSVADLEAANGAWFLGNAAGAGKRWGNGLSFKNELRVANQPYNGPATINSRCMLPGCNGTFAGRTLEMQVQGGKIEGTLDVGGHSGPFQIEIVTPQGSLRHQYEGSSHVERDMMVVSGGVGYTHRVGLAPYENTVAVPGRQLYVESQKDSSDAPFLVDSIVAKDNNGKAVKVAITKQVKSPRIVVWVPNSDGTYAAKDIVHKADLAAGEHLSLPVSTPYSLVVLGGFVNGVFKEGWAMVFSPAGLQVSIDTATVGGPNQPLVVNLKVAGGGKVTGILEVFDNRVASKSAMSGLGSAIGDSVRSSSRAVASWRDNTGISEEDESPRQRHRDEEGKMGKKEMSLGDAPAAPPPPSPKPMMSPSPMKVMAAHAGPSGGKNSVGGNTNDGKQPDEDAVPKDIIREGEKKVVACLLIETDANGNAKTQVTLPPQTGRVVVRFVAVKGLDHAESQKQVDVKLSASVDARLPRFLVPGAEMKVQVDITNTLSAPVQLVVKGTGVVEEARRQVPPGQHTETVTLVAKESGKLVLQLSDLKGKPLDRRELAVTLLGDQEVTVSRLEFAGGQGISVAADEELVVYAGAGPLLQGVVMNMFTTTESWFGHAEALSAKVAVHAVLLSAIQRGLLSDEGLGEQLRSTLNSTLRALDEQFMDKSTGLCRPYPGLAGDPLWSAWVSRNLHSALRALDAAKSSDGRVKEARELAKAISARLDATLKSRKVSTTQLGGYDDSGESVIPVEVDGKIVYKALTDDAVSRFAIDKLFPKIDFDAKNAELGFGKAYDAFRFLKAFERTGSLQYQTDIATALYLKGERQKFAQLYRHITRGMILTQEPGMIQGPALLGGVYSTPMAMVRFLELQLLLGKTANATSKPSLAGRPVAYNARIKNTAGTLTIPDGAIARVDKRTHVRWDSGQAPALATVTVTADRAAIGAELGFEVSLSSDLDPSEYYALVAVPSTVAIKQTADILSDYKGQLLYGQQVTGGTRMQLLAIPFRGSRSMKLVLEGAYPGHSPGKVAIRHIEKAEPASIVPIRDLSVE